MKEKRIYWLMAALVLSAVLIAVSLLALGIGAVYIPVERIPSFLFSSTPSSEQSILLSIRLPRILMGLAVGGSLSVSGVLLQGMFRNPLVEPYTLGISGGAALGVCLAIVFGLMKVFGAYTLPAAGFAGALAVTIILYVLSMKQGIIRIQGLLLTGVMVSFVASSLIMLLMAMAKADDLHGIIYWTMGSLDGTNTTLVLAAVIAAVAGLIASLVFSLDLNALAMGEDDAHALGVNTERVKRILFVIASLLTGIAVSVAGVIGFVGLLMPHMMRRIVGSDHRILLIASFLSGASFLVLCDTLARVIIAPLELPVGVITGIAGGVLFIILLSRKRAAA